MTRDEYLTNSQAEMAALLDEDWLEHQEQCRKLGLNPAAVQYIGVAGDGSRVAHFKDGSSTRYQRG